MPPLELLDEELEDEDDEDELELDEEELLVAPDDVDVLIPPVELLVEEMTTDPPPLPPPPKNPPIKPPPPKPPPAPGVKGGCTPVTMDRLSCTEMVACLPLIARMRGAESSSAPSCWSMALSTIRNCGSVINPVNVQSGLP